VGVAARESFSAPEVRAIADAKLLGTTDWTPQERMPQLATEIYK
jgi:hypothetical protein